jgi:hypothetical protein
MKFYAQILHFVLLTVSSICAPYDKVFNIKSVVKYCDRTPEIRSSQKGRPLLGNGWLNTFQVLRCQQIHVRCWAAVLVTRVITSVFGKTHWTNRTGTLRSTVTLRVVGGNEKGNLDSETVKNGRESYGTRTREWLRWRLPAAIVNDRPVLSLERAPHINKPATVWQ